MALALRYALRGDLRTFLKNDVKAGARSVTNVVRRRTVKIKQAIRAAIKTAGLGTRLGNAIRDVTFPQRGVSLNAHGRVTSRATYKRPGGFVDLITVFREGATINSREGTFLAVQIGAGIQFGTQRRAKKIFIDPKTMALIPLRSGKGYLVVRLSPNRGRDSQGNYGQPVLLLIKQATINKRLDIDSIETNATSGIENEIVSEWEKQAARLGVAD